ncbi:PEP-CTERM sorting domain-containing protein [Roseateles sp. UC29_93]|uniref:PEP-CTERM sorting domain-containing protein n=1 Tax=Roseateles sp. UC29_93 TaxID=3350177 RepID=UPI003670C820
MTKRWMVALVGAMLSPVAMATVTVTFEGFYTSQNQAIDCAPMDSSCVGTTTTLGTPIAFSQSFSFEYGVSPGRLPFVTTLSHGQDGTGRAYDWMTASQRYSNFLTHDLADAQVPRLPIATFDPVDRTGAQLDVNSVARRIRSVHAWTDTGETLRSDEAFSLNHAVIWTNADGSYSQDSFSISPASSPSFEGTVANAYDVTSDAYFLTLMDRLGGCAGCLTVSLSNRYARADGVTGSTSLTGFGRIVSITETASAVPEPSTYALMLAGVAAIGFAARRRKSG